jgi:hypothetical protein
MVTNIEYKPSDILGMIRELFNCDLDREKTPLLPHHYICNSLCFMARMTRDYFSSSPRSKVFIDKFPDYCEWARKEENHKEVWRLINDVETLVNVNKPSEELFTEFYNHPFFKKESNIHQAWWNDSYNLPDPIAYTVLTQKVLFLDVLISKLKENGQ